MTFDTLVTTVYWLVDTFVAADASAHPGSGRGRPKQMSDAEVITLDLIGQRSGNSERHVLDLIVAIDPTLFPHLVCQRAFNQRVRDLQPVMARFMVSISEHLDRSTTPYELADVVMVPVVRRCRAGQSPRLADLVSGGKGGSERTWIEGCSLLLATTERGAITGCVLGSARTEGHWMLDALHQWRYDPTSDAWLPADIPIPRTPKGPDKPILGRDTAGTPAVSRTYLVDNGFRGDAWHTHWNDLGATVELDGGPDAPNAERTEHHAKRQRIETINGILKEHLHLAYPGAKTIAGILTRITAKCCMLNLGMLINRLYGRPELAIGTLIRM